MAVISALKARKSFKKRLILGFAIQPLRLFCTHCGKYLPSDIPWICGFCDAKNYLTKRYSFLHKCQRCKRAPTAFVCPSCAQLVGLDRQPDLEHPARAISNVIPPVIESADAFHSRRAKEREHQRAELNHEVEVAKLNKELVALKKTPEFKAKKTQMEHLRERFSEHEAHLLGVYMIEKEKRAQYAIEFAGDPERLEQGEDIIRSFREEQGAA